MSEPIRAIDLYLAERDDAARERVNAYGATSQCLNTLLEFLISVRRVECFEQTLEEFYTWYAGPDTIPTPHCERDLLIGWAARALHERDEFDEAARCT